eukprot:UN28431
MCIVQVFSSNTPYRSQNLLLNLQHVRNDYEIIHFLKINQESSDKIRINYNVRPS